MFCTKCGKELPDGTVFCPSCGVQLNNEVSGYEINKQAFNVKEVHNIVAIIGAILTVLGLFLPYRKVSILGTTISVSQMNASQGDIILGIIMIGIVLLAMWMMFKQKNAGYMTISVILALLGVFMLFGDDAYLKGELGDYRYLVSHGIGFYFMIIGPIVMVVAGIMRAAKK